MEDKYSLSKSDIDRIIEMAWEDRTTFDAIFEQSTFSTSISKYFFIKSKSLLAKWKILFICLLQRIFFKFGALYLFLLS